MDDEPKARDSAPARRLCGEIRLFDLCNLDDCGFKSGKFCTNPDLLARFEAISEEDAVRHPDRYDTEDMDEPEEDDYYDYEDEAGDGSYPDEANEDY